MGEHRFYETYGIVYNSETFDAVYLNIVIGLLQFWSWLNCERSKNCSTQIYM